ncbi:BON domain-containing protein [Luteimonas sp. RD2P54]|uniref:BON domain-containing protein n=1 Tax=Luteimonas endophytica TaxID=3042023 RepID=A0ABT6JDB7_9GAMM|nr:BON domain-containing protein [Luteimonas endophytica]MDH5824814.1 BON domain-containing protein [Luteimonas endophytica]
MNELIKRNPRNTLAAALSVALMLAAGGVMAQEAAADADAQVDTQTRTDAGMESDQPVNDTWITTKVKSSLLADTDVAGLQVEVETVNGVVSLSGDVESRAQIDAAKRIAAGIEGVTNVDASGLTVAPAATDRDTDMRAAADARMDAREDARMDVGMESDQPIDDTWITTKVKSSLLADTDVAGLQVEVETVNGEVSLTGGVESQAQIDAARRIAADIDGVASVDTSGLRVERSGDAGAHSHPHARADDHASAEAGARHATDARAETDMDMDMEGESDQPIDDTWITTKVKSSLLADTDVAGLQIDVETVNGVVTLSGDVESQAQIDAAKRIAADIEGVASVDASALTVSATGE